MDRREVLAAAAGVVPAVGAGCLGGDGADPAARIGFVELENHRRERGYDFAVRIEDGEDLAFEATRRLGPAGSSSDAVAIQRPVADPGAYSVTVAAAGDSATAETGEMVSGDRACLGLQFYLGATDLHLEDRAYRECE